MVTTGGHAIAMGKIHITRHDLERFQSVVDIQDGPEAPFIEKPKKELYRATILEPTNVPGDVVTMNSIVRVWNINTAGERAFLLAFPVKTGSQARACFDPVAHGYRSSWLQGARCTGMGTAVRQRVDTDKRNNLSAGKIGSYELQLEV